MPLDGLWASILLAYASFHLRSSIQHKSPTQQANWQMLRPSSNGPTRVCSRGGRVRSSRPLGVRQPCLGTFPAICRRQSLLGAQHPLLGPPNAAPAPSSTTLSAERGFHAGAQADDVRKVAVDRYGLRWSGSRPSAARRDAAPTGNVKVTKRRRFACRALLSFRVTPIGVSGIQALLSMNADHVHDQPAAIVKVEHVSSHDATQLLRPLSALAAVISWSDRFAPTLSSHRCLPQMTEPHLQEFHLVS